MKEKEQGKKKKEWYGMEWKEGAVEEMDSDGQ